mgnify:FL=1
MPRWELPCTVKQLVQKYLDINGPPRRYFFELLSFFTSDEREKEKLLEFASSQGQVLMSIFRLSQSHSSTLTREHNTHNTLLSINRRT